MSEHQKKFQFVTKDVERLARALDRLIHVLADGRWYRAAELARMFTTTDRMIRRLADLSDGRVISGQNGYKLTRCATTEEIDHAEAWLLSQARKMTDRAREIRIARNRSGVAA